jgi:hypothetical protein
MQVRSLRCQRLRPSRLCLGCGCGFGIWPWTGFGNIRLIDTSTQTAAATGHHRVPRILVLAGSSLRSAIEKKKLDGASLGWLLPALSRDCAPSSSRTLRLSSQNRVASSGASAYAYESMCGTDESFYDQLSRRSLNLRIVAHSSCLTPGRFLAERSETYKLAIEATAGESIIGIFSS